MLPVLCSPTEECFEMEQGFHCEPMIVFQLGTMEMQESVCEGFCQIHAVVWAVSGWMLHQCACKGIIHACKRVLCC